MQTAYKEILEQLSTELPELKWIDLDRGQIDQPNDHYTVAFPAVFISFNDIPWDGIGQKLYAGNCTISFRLAFQSYNDSNNNTPESVREAALLELGIRQKLNAVLEGLTGSNFNELKHANTNQEPRDDGLLVFNESYSCLLMDGSAVSDKKKVDDVGVNVSRV